MILRNMLISVVALVSTVVRAQAGLPNQFDSAMGNYETKCPYVTQSQTEISDSQAKYVLKIDKKLRILYFPISPTQRFLDFNAGYIHTNVDAEQDPMCFRNPEDRKNCVSILTDMASDADVSLTHVGTRNLDQYNALTCANALIKLFIASLSK